MQLARSTTARRSGRGSRLIALAVCYVVLSPGVSCSEVGQIAEPERHEFAGSPPLELDPVYYWSYEMLGKLSDVRLEGGRVEGLISERRRKMPFVVDASAVANTEHRAAGYREAIARCLSFMAPGGMVDNEANRTYRVELEQRLRRVTGLDLAGYEAWRAWFASNGDRLAWSDEDGRLIVRAGAGE